MKTPEIELEAYQTAWRELREWAKKESAKKYKQSLDHDGEGRHTLGFGFFSENVALETVINKMEELEKSHVLD